MLNGNGFKELIISIKELVKYIFSFGKLSALYNILQRQKISHDHRGSTKHNSILKNDYDKLSEQLGYELGVCIILERQVTENWFIHQINDKNIKRKIFTIILSKILFVILFFVICIFHR